MFPEGRLFDFLIVGAVALIVVGPKDLPVLMRKVGRFMAPETVVAAALRAIDRGRPTVITGARNRLLAASNRFAPRALAKSARLLRSLTISRRSVPSVRRTSTSSRLWLDP